MFLNLRNAARDVLIRAAASTQPLGAFFLATGGAKIYGIKSRAAVFLLLRHETLSEVKS